jgi:hypothetical protein
MATLEETLRKSSILLPSLLAVQSPPVPEERHSPQVRRPGSKSTATCTTQQERPHAFRMPERQLLRNHSAHRRTHYVSAFNARRIHNCRRIPRHGGDPVRPSRHIAPPHAPVIEHNRPVPPRDFRKYPRPHFQRKTQAHDHQHGLPGTVALPVNLRLV